MVGPFLFPFMKTYAIVVAAGYGKRFGGFKQFELLAGRPLIYYCLTVLEESPSIGGIALVVPEEEVARVRSLLRGSNLQKIRWVVPGGSRRQDSVARGFSSLPGGDAVLVHDGVRPFLTSELVERIVQLLQGCEAVVPGLPVRETVKEIDQKRQVVRTVDRTSLWNIQTPQGFRMATLKKALERARQDDIVATDEAALVERIGVPVHVTEGLPSNLKLTTREDLAWAEWFVERDRP